MKSVTWSLLLSFFSELLATTWNVSRNKRQMLLKHFFKMTFVCLLVFYTHLISHDCFFIVVWNRHLQIVKLKGPAAQSQEMMGRPLLHSAPCHQCHYHLVFEFIQHEPRQGKCRVFFSSFLSSIQYWVKLIIYPVTLCWLNIMC